MRTSILLLVIIALLMVLSFIAAPVHAAECGGISWYGSAHHGRKTASGERFDKRALTAAHRSLPFGTMVKVTIGKRHLSLRINDRGPFVKGRILDVSEAAAERLGLIQPGVARGCVTKD